MTTQKPNHYGIENLDKVISALQELVDFVPSKACFVLASHSLGFCLSDPYLRNGYRTTEEIEKLQEVLDNIKTTSGMLAPISDKVAAVYEEIKGHLGISDDINRSSLKKFWKHEIEDENLDSSQMQKLAIGISELTENFFSDIPNMLAAGCYCTECARSFIKEIQEGSFKNERQARNFLRSAVASFEMAVWAMDHAASYRPSIERLNRMLDKMKENLKEKTAWTNRIKKNRNKTSGSRTGLKEGKKVLLRK